MTNLIIQFLAPFSIRIMACTAIIVAIILTLLGTRNSGRNAERVDQLRKLLEIQRGQLEATIHRPRNRDELIERMREGRF